LRIYITHCSAKKDDSLKGTGKKVTPDELYTGRRIRSFIAACRREKVDWAIFSDFFGIWFPSVEHEWYDKAPNCVTEQEFRKLLLDFEEKLADYDEIWFYHNPSRFHSLYGRLLTETELRGRIRRFTHIAEITRD
jgi:hypothetical protein